MLRSCRFLVAEFGFGAASRPYAVKSVGGSSGMMGLGKGKKGGGGGAKGPATEKPVLPVETDPHRLVNYVCGSNVMTTGEDVQLKPDSEYPKWLWYLRTGPPPTLQELDPDTKKYWLKVRSLGMRRTNHLSKFKVRKY